VLFVVFVATRLRALRGLRGHATSCSSWFFVATRPRALRGLRGHATSCSSWSSWPRDFVLFV